MSKRLASEAKLVLERAGYTVSRSTLKRGAELRVYIDGALCGCLFISGGTVENTKVVNLLKARGLNEVGLPIKS